jgi:hypothetical protein
MKGHRRAWFVVVISITLCVLACVTVNIYFPAEKVESVAGELVNEIRSNEAEGQGAPLKNEQSSLLQNALWTRSCSVAWAEEETAVSNPTIRALKESMKSRYAQLKPFYEQGMLKEDDNGYLSQGETSGLGLKEKRDLKNLIDAENKDREQLYNEVAKALEIDPGQIDRVGEIFAKEWQK